MINVRAFIASLKLSWLRRMQENEIIKDFILNMYPVLRHFEHFGGDYVKVLTLSMDNDFWKDVFKHFKALNDKCSPQDVHEFMNECIHYNLNILRDTKSIFIKELCDHNIFFVKQLVNEAGEYKSYDEICREYPTLRINFLTYRGIVQAVKYYQNRLDISITNNYKLLQPKVWFILRKGNRFVQTTLTENNASPAAVFKWNQMFPHQDWKKIFRHCFANTTDTKLRWFQSRILHRLLPTHKYLFLCGIMEEPTCNFCHIEDQTILHLMVECRYVQQFWKEFQEQIVNKNAFNINLVADARLILFGVKDNVQTDPVLDFLILYAKFFIYKCKLDNKLPTLQAFLPLIKHRHMLEKYKASVNCKLTQFNQVWMTYHFLFE